MIKKRNANGIDVGDDDALPSNNNQVLLIQTLFSRQPPARDLRNWP
jgi:hypothetical protein